AFATKIPHGREHLVWVSWIERERGSAGGEVCAFQHKVPGLPAIGSLIKTSVRRIAPERSRHSRKDCVTACWTDDDLRDPFRVGQTGMAPSLTAVPGFVDPIANRNAIPRP